MAFFIKASFSILLLVLFSFAFHVIADDNPTPSLVVNAQFGRKIPETFFGIFFEEINHAGAGGLWAELVDNAGFEAGGSQIPSNIFPWSIIGDESTIRVTTERSSPFPRNKIAARLDIMKNSLVGVGLSNPGFWGMNVQKGKKYKVTFYARSPKPVDLKIAFVGANGKELASANIRLHLPNWKKIQLVLKAKASDFNSSLQITTTKQGTLWLDQISALPLDTHKGHGFRKDLFQMVADLKPRFLRFPGGCYVEGDWLRNAFRWKDTIGPREKRPGHFNDVWGYWTDDGFGYLEFLQLAEDLKTLPVWVFNNGISHHDQVNTSNIGPFVQEALDGIEFARGPVTSKWGKLRAKYGHPKPFDLRYVAIGNEDCGKDNYLGNYLKFYNAIKHHYPDIKMITNCDATESPLDMPADFYDYHKYTSSHDIFSLHDKFDYQNRTGAKAFVSEYAVWKDDARNGTLLSALGEAGFLMGLEKNSDLVEMVSYAPLFVNANDKRWTPDAIVFDSHRSYGIPSYWLQQLFTTSSGATYLDSKLEAPSTLIATAIRWEDQETKKSYLRIKVVNFHDNSTRFNITINGLDDDVDFSGATKTLLTSGSVWDENSFDKPRKIVPVQSPLDDPSTEMLVTLPANSVTAFDLPLCFRSLLLSSATTSPGRAAALLSAFDSTAAPSDQSLFLLWLRLTFLHRIRTDSQRATSSV
ncbi:alpha-L-arabinofuranosidase 1-like [Neltuma alba]|uniref:alpha-L-arabinofuranosidase 1-like n=1 Tax=Neltuma alba TaxID=207710 RepID=UPI0010A2F60D|nr:alpha-L-arabinofuranosidase 1-like [Prosopis alba]